MQPTMTIIKKDGTNFPVPYSEQNVLQYQKILGEQLADIIFNNVDNPPNIQFASGPKHENKPASGVDLSEVKAEISKLNVKMDMIYELLIKAKPGPKPLKEKTNNVLTPDKSLYVSEK